MFKDWILTDLRTTNIKYESAAASKEKISGVQIKELGGYLNIKLTNKSGVLRKPSNPEKNAINVV